MMQKYIVIEIMIMRSNNKHGYTYLYSTSNIYIISLSTHFIKHPNIYQSKNTNLISFKQNVLGRWSHTDQFLL